ncbi:deleted in malignant brain tumors 1 protein-like [Tachysurus ichikawai]
MVSQYGWHCPKNLMEKKTAVVGSYTSVTSFFSTPQKGTFLCCSSNSAADYEVMFWILASQSRWNNTVLLTVFGKRPELQADLAFMDVIMPLSQLITRAIWLDNLLCQEQAEGQVMDNARCMEDLPHLILSSCFNHCLQHHSRHQCLKMSVERPVSWG